MDQSDKPGTILLTKQVCRQLEQTALRKPTKDGMYSPRLIQALIEHVEKVHGVSLEIETEQMRDERIKREIREDREKRKRGNRMGRKSPSHRSDDF